MTVTTSNIHSYDSKQILWKTLKDEMDALAVAFPDKVDVKVTKIYPQLVEELDKYLALITIARVSAPQEMLFVGDGMVSELSTAEQFSKLQGILNTDYYEIAIWSNDPDYRDQMYYVVRQIMMEKKKALARLGLSKIIRTGGGDQEIDLVGLPRVIYRGIHMYMIQSAMTYETLYDLVSTINVTQTVRVKIDSETNETTETKTVPVEE